MTEYTTFQSGTLATPPAGLKVAMRIIDGVKYQELIMYGKTGDATYQVPRFDANTHVLKMIALSHSKIHDGSHFFCRGFTDLANGATYRIVFVTPNTAKLSHFTLEIGHEGEAALTVTENITADANGTEMNIFNRNREFARVAGAEGNTSLTYHTPTNPAGGTVLVAGREGSGKKFGSKGRDAEEVVMARNYKYLFEILNGTANNNLINWPFDWYEHESKTA